MEFTALGLSCDWFCEAMIKASWYDRDEMSMSIFSHFSFLHKMKKKKDDLYLCFHHLQLLLHLFSPFPL